jgi:hypothetical protein
MAQVAVCSQTITKHINTVWKEHTIVKIFNLLVHPVTSRLLKVNALSINVCYQYNEMLVVKTTTSENHQPFAAPI